MSYLCLTCLLAEGLSLFLCFHANATKSHDLELLLFSFLFFSFLFFSFLFFFFFPFSSSSLSLHLLVIYIASPSFYLSGMQS
ncbi:hypothetical protein F9C07_1127857 [Aspergillus flavus]|uniref:Uncharacterized protein n=1 Tax=Aspergillus flavus (strain ATCC 200026 / FGSC A1120 / IAM 13836 / NRRL 3357 / JCM 12722 / SRRC 167) TaxID=332952 RepID=A0A7U2MRX0_ASPFN|nr:hypothetical protein F9C07_1127857 [Aspergillus flavus]